MNLSTLNTVWRNWLL